MLSWLLNRRGITTSLRIGVARRQDTLDAHAWLEHNGRIILGEAEARTYAPFQPFSGEAADR